jgi:uncharacterized membrane protein YeiH
MMTSASNIYTFLDLVGTFVFALSGAVAARQKGLDIFGIFSIAFTVACGGGIIRDLCIGAVPPAGLTNGLYLIMVLAATVISIGCYGLVKVLNQPVLVFDALGLSVFAVTGARKSIVFGHDYEVAILLGVVTAVGGGVIRDILLDRVPVILRKEIYASAALAGAAIVVVGDYLLFSKEAVSATAIIVCFGLRFLGLHFHLNLPSFRDNEIKRDD